MFHGLRLNFILESQDDEIQENVYHKEGNGNLVGNVVSCGHSLTVVNGTTIFNTAIYRIVEHNEDTQLFHTFRSCSKDGSQ